MSLSYKQAKIVQSTLPALRLHGERIASLFYATMLQQHPELRDTFNTANMQNGRQPRALTTIIIAFAANLSHTSDIIPQLERVCQRHCSLGIRPEQYAIVGEYLIRAFHAVLGPSWTPEVQDAWTDAYCVLARMMIGREAHLYRTFATWTTWRRMRVAKKVAESEDVYSFYLEPLDEDEDQDQDKDKEASLAAHSSVRNSSSLSISSSTATATTATTSSHNRSSMSSRGGDPRRSSVSSLSGASASGCGSGSGSGGSRYGSFTSRLRTNNVHLHKLKNKSSSSLAHGHDQSNSHSHSRRPKTLPYYFPGQYISVRMLVAEEESDDDGTGSSGGDTTTTTTTTDYGRHSTAARPHAHYQARQYSLSDRWRPGGGYRISVKRDAGTRFANAVASSFFHAGAVSNALIDQVDVGATLEVSHPAGVFFLNVDPELVEGTYNTYDDSITARSPLRMHPPLRTATRGSGSDPLGSRAPPLVLISAGIGAAPLVAMARMVAETQPQRPVTYVHGSRYAPAVFSAEIRALQLRQGERGALRTAYFYSGTGAAAVMAETQVPMTEDGLCLSFAGHVDLDRLRHVALPRDDDSAASSPTTTTTATTATTDSFGDDDGGTDLLFLHNSSTEYYVCGPESFMLAMAVQLVDKMGVSRQRILYELHSTGEVEAPPQDGGLHEFMKV